MSQAKSRMKNSFTGGMQVHAVPEDERAIDSQGKQLPWGFLHADPTLNRKQPVERGPFGRPTTSRRASSRSKTLTPGPKDDPVTTSNQKAIDDIFGSFKKELASANKENKAPPTSHQDPKPTNNVVLQDQISQDPSLDTTSSAPQPPPSGSTATFKEPTEVLIYGYGTDFQWSAISFYENTSGGRIYEDYDRSPSDAGRYISTFTTTTQNVRPQIPRSLPAESVRKINTYNGGDHWIKVTFDSPEAADRARYFSPKIINGYLTYAEPWRGTGPSVDEAINPASVNPSGASTQRRRIGGASTRDFSSLPSRMHERTPAFNRMQQNENKNSDSPDSSATLSSATATGNDLPPQQSLDRPTDNQQQNPQQLPQNRTDITPPPKPLKIPTAKRAQLLPSSQAFLPQPPWYQSAFGKLPLTGFMFGGEAFKPHEKALGSGTTQGGVIGGSVPRKEDGRFDWEGSGWYWRICWLIDSWLGGDLCGLRGDE